MPLCFLDMVSWRSALTVKLLQHVFTSSDWSEFTNRSKVLVKDDYAMGSKPACKVISVLGGFGLLMIRNYSETVSKGFRILPLLKINHLKKIVTSLILILAFNSNFSSHGNNGWTGPPTDSFRHEPCSHQTDATWGETRRGGGSHRHFHKADCLRQNGLTGPSPFPSPQPSSRTSLFGFSNAAVYDWLHVIRVLFHWHRLTFFDFKEICRNLRLHKNPPGLSSVALSK